MRRFCVFNFLLVWFFIGTSENPVPKTLETEIECTTYPDACDHFALTEISREQCRTEDGKDGCSYHCSVEPYYHGSIETPAHVFNVISYNIFELNYWIDTCGQRERTCRIPQAMAEQFPEVDVIAFQEVFVGGCFTDNISLRDLLSLAGYRYFTKTVGDPIEWPPTDHLQVTNGGIMIASKYPILAEKQFVFHAIDPWSPDRFMAKGVVYAKIQKSTFGKSKIYHVFNTHYIFAQEPKRQEVRLEQSKEFADFIKQQGIPTEEPVLLGGDFNMDWNSEMDHVHDIVRILNAGLPPHVGEWDHSHGPYNDLLPPDKEKKYLDYVLYRLDHQLPDYVTQEVIPLYAHNPVEVCLEAPLTKPGYTWPNADYCEKAEQIRDLSDHYPVLVRYIFPKVE